MQQISQHTTKQGGYIALMATIIISIILLALVGQEAFAGSYARFAFLGGERKEQSSSLAQGCVALATLQLAQGAAHISAATYTLQGGSCELVSFSPDTPSSGFVTVHARAVVGEAHTNLEAVVERSNFSVVSTREVPHF